MPACAKPTREPLDRYQQFAAQVFEERFCPLRVGMQQPAQRTQQPGEPKAVPAGAVSTAPRQPPPSPSAECEQLQWGQKQQHQQQQQQLVLAAVSSPFRQERLPAALHCRRELPASPPRRQLETDAPAQDKQEQQTLVQFPAAVGSSLVASSNTGSTLSYASEDADAVMLASPSKGASSFCAWASLAPNLLCRSSQVSSASPFSVCWRLAHPSSPPSPPR